MMTTLLEGLPGIEVVASVSGSAEALGVEQPLDVALLDWALGPDSLNGVELGRALRQRVAPAGRGRHAAQLLL